MQYIRNFKFFHRNTRLFADLTKSNQWGLYEAIFIITLSMLQLITTFVHAYKL